MAQILVRDLDDALVSRLKEQAKENHRSLQGEVKAILERGVRRKMSRAEMIKVSAEWQEFWHRQGRRFTDSADLVREDRDR